MDSYVERAPLPALAHVVRTTWIQRTGASAYAQRHLPAGGVEIHVPIGAEPRLLGPLTGPHLDVIPARTVVVGVRFLPGAAVPSAVALDDLVDQHPPFADVWDASAHRLAEAMAAAGSAEHALELLQRYLLFARPGSRRPDPLVQEAVRMLMPWQPTEVVDVATHLGLSASQLRRRFLRAVGLGPKALQRTLRFQGFLALAQAGATTSGRRGVDGIAAVAIGLGYADQAHLSRECLRLAGVTPSRLLGGDLDRCACGHDHAASYLPFLATSRRPARSMHARFVQARSSA